MSNEPCPRVSIILYCVCVCIYVLIRLLRSRKYDFDEVWRGKMENLWFIDFTIYINIIYILILYIIYILILYTDLTNRYTIIHLISC